jgi:hypothetical protein
MLKDKVIRPDLMVCNIFSSTSVMYLCFAYIVILAHGLACTSIVFDSLFNDTQLNAAVYLVRDLIKTI